MILLFVVGWLAGAGTMWAWALAWRRALTSGDEHARHLARRVQQVWPNARVMRGKYGKPEITDASGSQPLGPGGEPDMAAHPLFHGTKSVEVVASALWTAPAAHAPAQKDYA